MLDLSLSVYTSIIYLHCLKNNCIQYKEATILFLCCLLCDLSLSLTPKSPSSCLSFVSTGKTGMLHHTRQAEQTWQPPLLLPAAGEEEAVEASLWGARRKQSSRVLSLCGNLVDCWAESPRFTRLYSAPPVGLWLTHSSQMPTLFTANFPQTDNQFFSFSFTLSLVSA